jgi:pimeloyl-ACP methyl ester carboxylesterase
MYYEIHGRGRPLVLLHGAFCTIETCFGRLLPGLAANHQVIAIEQQGHGHTGDTSRPLSISQMASDTAALLQQLGINYADFLGDGMGASIGLHLAIHQPQLVGKLVLLSPVAERAGFKPTILAGIERLDPDAFADTPARAAYMQVAPNPSDFPRLVYKIQQLERDMVDIPAAELTSIHAPTLMIVGDSDVMRPEYVSQLYRQLGGGAEATTPSRTQLAVLPGTTHTALLQRTAWLTEMITAFLDAPAPPEPPRQVSRR